MPLHLVKLCVGIDDVAHLHRVQQARLDTMAKAGATPLLAHITRMTPRRAGELLKGGSLYWVIKGQIQTRQPLLDIVRFTDTEGVSRCKLMLDRRLILVRPQLRRAFQGWRYFDDADAPQDLSSGKGDIAEMPAEMRANLIEMGLI